MILVAAGWHHGSKGCLASKAGSAIPGVLTVVA